MSDEPTERDVEDRVILGLMRTLAPVVEQRRHHGLKAEDAEVYARAVLASDWYAERIAQARREGAAEVEDWKQECLRWRDEAEAGNYDTLIRRADTAERKVAAVDALLGANERQYEAVNAWTITVNEVRAALRGDA